jgi:hypothetical protein
MQYVQSHNSLSAVGSKSSPGQFDLGAALLETDGIAHFLSELAGHDRPRAAERRITEFTLVMGGQRGRQLFRWTFGPTFLLRYGTCGEEGYGHKRSELQWQAIPIVGAEPDQGGRREL